MNDEDTDRRNSELSRLTTRVAVLEEKQSDMDKIVSGMNYALFGIPQDRSSNNGMVGTVATIQKTLSRGVGLLVATLLTEVVRIAIG